MRIRKATIGEFLLEALRDAQDGLRRKSIDEVDEFIARCEIFGRAQWPPEVARFVDTYKRPRGRMRSEQGQVKRFFGDPNRVAAAYAADLIDDLRQRPTGKPKRYGPYKIPTENGLKSKISAYAVRKAVEYVNKNYKDREFGDRKAHPNIVAEMLRRGRGRYPPFDW
jgi:hypothetical protein